MPPLLEAFLGGFRIFADNARMIAKLSFIPFAFTLLTLVVLRTFNDALTIFYLPVLSLPSSFVVGLQCGLLLRFLMLGEHPLAPQGEERRIRNKAISESALVYTAVTYFVTGIYAVLLKGQDILKANPEAAAPYMPIAAAVLVFMMWGSRWLWLHIPVAVDWPVRDFYTRIGGWRGSLRVFALFAMCSLTMNFIAGFLRSLVSVMFRFLGDGFVAAFDDALVAVLTLALSILFTTVSVAAVNLLAKDKPQT